MMTEYVICGASLEGVCAGESPPDDLREAVDAVFQPSWQATAGYRLLTRIQGEGEEEVDLTEDGTYEEIPAPISSDSVLILGAVICDACYVTLCVLSPSGAGLTHELHAAINKAREMDPADLPAIR